MSKPYLIDLTVFVHYQTDKAILVENLDTNSDKVWLPLAAVEIEGAGTYVTLTLPRRLAEERGLA